MYMDDGSAGDQPANRATAVSRKVQEDLERAEFLVNEEKSNFTPKQRVQQLGFELDTCSNMLTASERRVQATKAAIQRTLELGSTKARELAKVAGHILSLSAVLGPVCRLWTRAIYEVIDKRLSWSSNMTLQRGVIQELAFWKDNLDELHGRPLWSSSPRGLLMCTDASDSGWGGTLLPTSGEWRVDEGGSIEKLTMERAQGSEEHNRRAEGATAGRVLHCQAGQPSAGGLPEEWEQASGATARGIGGLRILHNKRHCLHSTVTSYGGKHTSGSVFKDSR